MNILVCLKVVSKSTFTDTLSENEDRLSGGLLGINPADAYALEKALKIKERSPGTIVTVVTMAPDYAQNLLRDAIAVGADRAVHICDCALSGSDTLATAHVLASAINTLPPQDIILCGKKAIDSETGHIGAQLAVMLGIPFAANVLELEVSGSTLSFTCAREGYTAAYTGNMPALLSICNGTDMVRAPTINGIRRSKNAVIDKLSIDSLGLDRSLVGTDGSPTRTVKVESLSFRKGKKKQTSDTAKGAAEILRLCKPIKEVSEHD